MYLKTLATKKRYSANAIQTGKKDIGQLLNSNLISVVNSIFSFHIKAHESTIEQSIFCVDSF